MAHRHLWGRPRRRSPVCGRPERPGSWSLPGGRPDPVAWEGRGRPRGPAGCIRGFVEPDLPNSKTGRCQLPARGNILGEPRSTGAIRSPLPASTKTAARIHVSARLKDQQPPGVTAGRAPTRPRLRPSSTRRRTTPWVGAGPSPHRVERRRSVLKTSFVLASSDQTLVRRPHRFVPGLGTNQVWAGPFSAAPGPGPVKRGPVSLNRVHPSGV